MATITEFVDGVQAREHIGGHLVVAENKLDFSALNVSAADVVQAVKIPAGALVMDVWLKVTTAEGGAGNTDVGDADNVDGWDVDVDINAAALTLGDGAYAGGKYYAAEDTIDLIPSVDLDTAVVTVVVAYAVLERV